MYARDRMTCDVYTVEGDARLDEVYEMMCSMGIRHLPVVSGTKLVGVLSDRDILLRATLAGGKVLVPSMAVSEVMQREVTVTHEMAPLETVAKKMLHHKIDCLPVVTDDKLIGIITSTDLIGLLCKTEVPKAHQVIPITFTLKLLRSRGGGGPKIA